jgi:hypothetical protein
MLKYGIVGAGYWGSIVRKEISNSGANVEWTYDVLHDTELPTSPVDYIYIATPASVRLQPLKAFAHLAKNIIFAKPLALDKQELNQIIDFSCSMSLNIFCDHNFFYAPQVDFAISHLSAQSQNIVDIAIHRNSNGILKRDCTIYEDLFIHEYAFYERIRLHYSIPPAEFWSLDSHQIDQTPINLVHTALIKGSSQDLRLFTKINWLSPFKERSVEINSPLSNIKWFSQSFIPQPVDFVLATTTCLAESGTSLNICSSKLISDFPSSLSYLFSNNAKNLIRLQSEYSLEYWHQFYLFYFDLKSISI